jgi:hypothetical protein
MVDRDLVLIEVLVFVDKDAIDSIKLNPFLAVSHHQMSNAGEISAPAAAIRFRLLSAMDHVV